MLSSLQGGKTGQPEFLIAGLGNPGKEYAGTRHNAGFDALDFICDSLSCRCDRAKFDSLYCFAALGGKKVILLKPQTFMNASGTAVSEAADYFKIPHSSVIVLCDDISLAPGKIRIRRKGSDGGHRGLRSITGFLGTEDFPRIKIGVGDRPVHESELADWVLGKLTENERKEMTSRYDDILKAAGLIIAGDFEKAMNLYN